MNDHHTHTTYFTKSFTLLELLIVIGILAILSAVVILVINPIELLKQARDSERMQELRSINTALQLADLEGLSLGSANTVYVSVPDSSPTCANLGLPALPSGWSYRCAPGSTYLKVNGTGWIPVNFTQILGGSPLSALPIDPINTTSTGHYYTYVTGGSWELNAQLESVAKHDPAINDGGDLPGVYEVGSSKTLTPPTRDLGLVGFWRFEEGTGTSVADSSGKGNSGTLINGPVWLSGASCRVGRCLSFDGVDDFVAIGAGTGLNIKKNITIAALATFTGTSTDVRFIYKRSGNFGISLSNHLNSGKIRFLFIDIMKVDYSVISSADYNDGNWRFYVGTYDGANAKLFVDGAFVGSVPSTADIYYQTNYSAIGRNANEPNRYWRGLIDEVRIYNRALSDAEIAVLYNATK